MEQGDSFFRKELSEEDRDNLTVLMNNTVNKRHGTPEMLREARTTFLQEQIENIDNYLDGKSGTLDFENFENTIHSKEELERIQNEIQERLHDFEDNSYADQDPRKHLLISELELVKKYIESSDEKIKQLSPEITPEIETQFLDKKDILLEELSQLQNILIMEKELEDLDKKYGFEGKISLN